MSDSAMPSRVAANAVMQPLLQSILRTMRPGRETLIGPLPAPDAPWGQRMIGVGLFIA